MNRISDSMIDLMTRHALARSQRAMFQAMERLATGSRINRASDDPAGMIAAEQFEVRRVELEREITTLEQENHRLAATDGALGVLTEMATDLQGLVVAAANTAGLSEAEREAYQIEAESIIEGMNLVVNTTTFKGEQILKGADPGSLGSLSFQTDPSEGGEAETTTVTLADLAGGIINLVDGDLEMAQKVVSKAVDQLATRRGAVGNTMLANESRIRTGMAEFESTSAALSEIKDTDYAAEIAELTRAQIMEQAGIRAILMGRERRQQVLSLLGGS